MSLRAVIDMNNHAIACMQTGCPTESVSLLRSALTTLRQQFIGPTSNNCDNKEQQDSSRRTKPTDADVAAHGRNPNVSIDGPAPETSLLPSCVCREDANCKMDITAAQDGSQTYLTIESVTISRDAADTASLLDESFLPVYDRAIFIADCSSSENQETLTAVILFNLALNYHRRGTLRCQSSHLRKALEFYKMALGVVENATAFSYDDDNRHHHFVLLPLVALYNAAQICAQLYAVEEMRAYLGELRQLLSSDPEALSSTLRQDDYLFLTMHIMLYCTEGEELPVAAAA